MTAGMLFFIGLVIFVAALLRSGSDLDFGGRSVYSTSKSRGRPHRRRFRF